MALDIQDSVKPAAPHQPTLVPMTPAQPAAPAAAPTPPKSRKRLILGAVGLAVLAGAGNFGYGYWTDGRFMVSTDDAYVQTDIGSISAKIQGYVDTMVVVENQRVAKGDVIASLDDGDYRIALETAQSRIGTQAATLNRIKMQIAAAEASVGQAEAQKVAAAAVLHNADLTVQRTRALVASKSAAQATLDDDSAALDQASAAVAGADAQIASAKANVAVLQADYLESESQTRVLQLAVDQAQRNLDLTVLRAPYAGVVSNMAMEPGDLVSPGQRLAAIVPTDTLYIEANYKEGQLAGIAPGALVHVTIDALPDQTFEGRVEFIAPATGAMFSILPPSNATGNFTKVVQRVPVRISLPDDLLATGALRAGLSAVVEVDSRTSVAAK